MVFSTGELLDLVDELRERGVTYFKFDNIEVSMESPAPQHVDEDDDVEIEHTPGMSAEDILYYSST